MNDYLWEPSEHAAGEDCSAANVQQLEQSLAQFRSPRLDSVAAADALANRVAHSHWTSPFRLVFARTQTQLAVLAAAAVVALAFYFGWSVALPSSSTWNVSRISGSPRVGAIEISDRAQLHTGQSLVTDSTSRARIEVEDLGEISVSEDSRVRLLSAGPARGTLGLEQGTIHAMIWAPPQHFTVSTPGAEAVDLGCSYTLHVSPDGAGWIRVSTGWVAFTDPQAAGRESFIPVGAMCLIHSSARANPVNATNSRQSATNSPAQIGTPFYEDASETFRQSLEQFDFSDSLSAASLLDANTGSRSQALRLVLDEARQRDAITLWHLLARTDSAQRAEVYDRLAALVPPPSGIVRKTLLSSDPALAAQRREMRDLWWNALGLRDTGWWRYWERSSPPR